MPGPVSCFICMIFLWTVHWFVDSKMLYKIGWLIHCFMFFFLLKLVNFFHVDLLIKRNHPFPCSLLSEEGSLSNSQLFWKKILLYNFHNSQIKCEVFSRIGAFSFTISPEDTGKQVFDKVCVKIMLVQLIRKCVLVIKEWILLPHVIIVHSQIPIKAGTQSCCCFNITEKWTYFTQGITPIAEKWGF